MEKTTTDDENILSPNYHITGDIFLKNQDTLRKLVGVSGISLPVFLYIFLLADSGFTSVLPSISHYYFTRVSSIFIIIISLLAVFLLVYKGEDRRDYLISSLAGIFALMLLLFPTDNLTQQLNGRFDEVNVTLLNENNFRPKFHYFSAAIFLLSLDYMSFFLFTKSNLPPSKRTKAKVRRNRIYRVCSLFMTLAIVIMMLGFVRVIPASFYDDHQLTFWMEVVAVEAFGFSWMVKGESFFADKH